MCISKTGATGATGIGEIGATGATGMGVTPTTVEWKGFQGASAFITLGGINITTNETYDVQDGIAANNFDGTTLVPPITGIYNVSFVSTMVGVATTSNITFIIDSRDPSIIVIDSIFRSSTISNAEGFVNVSFAGDVKAISGGSIRITASCTPNNGAFIQNTFITGHFVGTAPAI